MLIKIGKQAGARLKHLREAREMTQADLAKLVSVTPKAISFYENGEREFPFEILLKFADIFRVTTDYILRGTSNVTAIVTDEITDEERGVIEQYRRLSREDRELVQTILAMRSKPKMEEVEAGAGAR